MTKKYFFRQFCIIMLSDIIFFPVTIDFINRLLEEYT